MTRAAIAKIPKLPTVNTLIAGEKVFGIRLYRLTSGELQVNVPPEPGQRWDYVFVWAGCDKAP